MSDYVKSTNFAAKDALSGGDPNKIIKGVEINTEFDDIATSVATKVEKNNGTHTGTTTMATVNVSGTLTAGTIDGGTF